MTTTLYDALKRMSTVRAGFVVRNLDGSLKTDGDASHVIEWICRRAPAGALLAHAAPPLRNPRRTAGREPVAAAELDGPQADRRDDAVRPRGREPRAGDPGESSRR